MKTRLVFAAVGVVLAILGLLMLPAIGDWSLILSFLGVGCSVTAAFAPWHKKKV